jgi:ubiquinone/menaquinone biosynthesis C-methylase UbiE
VIGVDFSMDMLDRARIGASEGAFVNTLFCRADAERLPVEDNSIDVALVNGIFNLNPSRSEIFRELARVVRPSGTVFAAELILSQPLPPDQRQSEANWFA